VVTTGATPLAAGVALASGPAALVARFAASLSPGVPLALAELLITPLLPALIGSLPLSFERLQADTPTVNTTADSAISIFLVT
jgi:hypothetical protein